jgi:DNA invertase Pin-like site-specific DNA recombinase
VTDNKRIHYIPPLPPKREKRVGIYCRVSTNSADQLKSLTAQVSALTRLTAANLKWLLVDVYIDIASSKTGSSRKEFSRMLQDCQSRDLEIILTKSISRFGRDTVEILDALNQLRVLGVRVIFEQEVGLATLFWTKLLRTRNYFNYSSYPADFRVFNPLYSTGVR